MIEEITESTAAVRERYVSYYFSVLSDLYTVLEERGGRFDIKTFCKENQVFYLATDLQKEGIIINEGTKGATADWRWVGPRPTEQQARAILKCKHLRSITSYPLPTEDAPLETISEQPLEVEEPDTPVLTEVQIVQAAQVVKVAVQIESKISILFGLLYSKTKYHKLN